MTNMPSLPKTIASVLSIAAILLVAACTKEAGEMDGKPPLARLRGASASGSSSVKLTHRVRGASEIAEKAAALVGILRPGKADALGLRNAALAAPRMNGSVHFSTADLPNVVVSYREDDDDLSVEDERIRGDHSAGADIGDLEASRRFDSALDALVAAALVQGSELDRKALVRSKIMEGEASSGGPTTVRVREYEFTAPRTKAGVPVFEAGVTVSFHRSGAMARIKIAGPSFVGDEPSGSVVPAVEQSAADALVAAAYPSAKVEPVGLTFWLPPGQAKDVAVSAVPQYLYLVYQRLPAKQDGRNLLSQAIIVAASAVDISAKLVVWPDLAQSMAPSDQKARPDQRP